MTSPSKTIAQDLNILRQLLDSLERQLAGTAPELGPLNYLQAREMRRQIFPGRYFGDPAWDIIVELYVAALSDTKFATSDIGLDAGIPMTTVLRYLTLLEQDGIIERWADPCDGRRVLVKLTPQGIEGLQRIFVRPRVAEPQTGDLKLAA